MNAVLNRREYLRRPVGRNPVREAIGGVIRAMPIGAAGKGMVGSNPDAATVLEDFESGNINSYGGDTSGFDVQQTTVKVGNDALRGDTGQTVISDTDISINQGATYRWWQNTGSSNFGSIVFGTQAEDNTPGGYLCELAATGQNRMQLREMQTDGELSTHGTNSTVALSASTWYECEFVWNADNSMTFKVLDDDNNSEQTVSTTDSTFTSGGLGFRQGESATSFWDYIRKVS